MQSAANSQLDARTEEADMRKYIDPTVTTNKSPSPMKDPQDDAITSVRSGTQSHHIGKEDHSQSQDIANELAKANIQMQEQMQDESAKNQ